MARPSDALADWVCRCSVVVSGDAGDITLGLVGATVVSGLSPGVVGEAIAQVGDRLELVSAAAMVSGEDTSDALGGGDCRCLVVDLRALAGGIVLSVPWAAVEGVEAGRSKKGKSWKG